jgi:predicted ATPase/serine/threonine protein kinase
MNEKRWRELKTSFDELLELEGEEHSARLATLASTDPEFFEELAHLLAADASADRRLRLLEMPLPPSLAVVGAPAAADDAERDAPALAATGADAELPRTGPPAPDPLDLSGRAVSHFQVREVLGCGGMGVVYRAEDRRLGRSVALKFLLPQFTLDALAKERFLQEARAASALDHPHICTIHEAGETEQGRLFLAMSYYAGETLHDRLSRERTLPLEEVLELTRQMLRGLGAAHAEGIVHRDLKPGNLMLSNGGTLKILDFGLAKVRDLSLTGAGMRPGTVAYMSPEQLQGEAVEVRSDLWSLGVVLYEMLTGRQPFGAGHELSTIYRILHEEPVAPSALRAEIPAELEEIVLRLLRREPDARYSSAADVLEALSRAEHRGRFSPQGPTVAPPHRSGGARSCTLPTPSTPLIGRQTQIREVRERLAQSEVRLLTLTGPGGTGKTRLALQVAAELAEEFADGVCFVNLAPISDPRLVPMVTAQTLGVREAAARPVIENLLDHLCERQILLVFDNYEHLLDAAPMVRKLLTAASELRVLVTSRSPLHLQGEHEYAVPPLSLPDAQRTPSLAQLAQFEAVQLFVDRALQVRPDFRLTSENASTIVEICQRLDGLPLAIELAAARVKILPPPALLARLVSRLRLLNGGPRDLPARHQTLRDAIAWSYELLGEREQVLFERLSVFAGGRTLEAIEVVCATEDAGGAGSGQAREQEVLEEVTSLVDKNLVRATEDLAGEPRFVMLETIQEFAAEKLQERGELERLRRRHAEYFLALAEQAEPQLIGPEQGRWLSRLVLEHDNLRAALRWLAGAEAEYAARLAGALSRFWIKRGLYREGRGWLRKVLTAPGLPPAVRAKTLLGAAILANFQNDSAAEPLLEEGLALARSVGDRRLIAAILQGLGHSARVRDDLAGATTLFEQVLVEQRHLGDRRGTSAVLGNLGSVAHVQGDYARAKMLSEESLTLAREVGDTTLAGFALYTLGHVAYEQGEVGRAGVLLRESLLVSRESGDVRIRVFAIANLGLVAGAGGVPSRAARLAGAAEACFAALATNMNAAARERYDYHLAAIRAGVEDAVWQDAWRRGSELTLEEAVACALEEFGEGLSGSA